MYIKINGSDYANVNRFHKPNEIVYTGDTLYGLVSVSGIISVYANNDFLLCEDNTEDYARQIINEGSITLTNIPEDYVPPKTLADRVNEIEQATAISFSTMAENGDIQEDVASNYPDLFKDWESGVSYSVGNLRSYEDVLYKCVQAHTSQDGWEPDIAVSLWSKAGDPTEEWPEWVQPTGAHDAYAKGAKVSHLGKHWISDIDANVYEPSVSSWSEVE